MQVHAKIQKWGNGLGLRVSGMMRDIPNFTEGAEVDVDITEFGLTIRKSQPKKQVALCYTEAQLLAGLTAEMAHADLLAKPLRGEMGAV